MENSGKLKKSAFNTYKADKVETYLREIFDEHSIERDALTKNIVALKQKNEELRFELEQKLNLFEQTQTLKDDYDCVKSELLALKEYVAGVELENQALIKRAEQYDEALLFAQNLTTGINQAKAQKDTVVESLKKAEESVVARDERIIVLEKTIAQLELEVSQLEERLIRAKAQADTAGSLLDENKELKANLLDCNSQRERLLVLNAALIKKTDDLKSKLVLAYHENDELRACIEKDEEKTRASIAEMLREITQ